jgi:rhodanese-related sulfurtransferase
VITICASGYRSTAAAAILEGRGFDEVAHLGGGMNAWTAAGMPLARGEEAEPVAPAP